MNRENTLYPPTRCAVLVSGGVDSAVALRSLQEQGHEVTAFYLKIWLEDELSHLGNCPWQEDLSYVKAVCDQAKVPLEVVSLQREYWQDVVSYVLSEIKSGRTPNPDIMCNQRIKFGAFERVLGLGFEKIATGHYAQVLKEGTDYKLYRSPDDLKDQTYFLSYLSQTQLARAFFPIGHMTKTQVREKARELNLPNKDRKDSQGICFLGKIKFSDFIRYHVGVQKGMLLEYETGKHLGEHEGFWYYTIGQRQGIRLSGGPWYVVLKDSSSNTVYISKQYYSPEKERKNLVVKDVNWIPGAPTLPACVGVKMRHGPHIQRGTLGRIEHSISDLALVLDERDQGISEGQFAVFYDGMRCMGGGVIKEGSF